MKVKKYNYLPEDAKFIREQVFIREQGFKVEFDDTDKYAVHLVAYDGTVPAGTCRYYKGQDGDTYVIGRVAVLKNMRGKHTGSLLLEEAQRQIAEAGGKYAELSSQVSASEFYEKAGYTKAGEVYYDEFCPHIKMIKTLDK